MRKYTRRGSEPLCAQSLCIPAPPSTILHRRNSYSSYSCRTTLAQL